MTTQRLDPPRTCAPASVLRVLAGLAGAVLTLPATANAQLTELYFSVDFQGPLMGTQSSSGGVITDADILIRSGSPFNPERPAIAIPATYISAYALCQGHPAGDACGLEINAFSFGKDARLLPTPGYQFRAYVSVDEFATGTPPPAGTLGTTVFSEALNADAPADVFASRLDGMGPFGPTPRISVGIVDGDGRASTLNSSAKPGMGLEEPLPRTPSGVDTGDNMDALNFGGPFDPTADDLFFSLQGGFAHCNEPAADVFNAAAQQQVVGGGPAPRSSEVLRLDPVLGVTRYASNIDLGLDLFGIGTDDIDALVVVENGVPGYQPPTFPYSWVGPQATDLVLFSLRCGSRTVGEDDSTFGLQITEGDILIKFAGVNGVPGIFIAAENLGLETVLRGGTSNDELDGFDLMDEMEEPFLDCNFNSVDDTFDILLGTSMDCDYSGIPDECEPPGVIDCTCEAPIVPPCGNNGAPGAGCANSFSSGATLVGMGTSSIATDFLSLNAANVMPGSFALMIMGDGSTPIPLANGRLCVGGGPEGLFRLAVLPTGTGSFVYGPGILGVAATLAPMPTVSIGSTWGFQAWYREIAWGTCTTGFANLTNAVRVTFTP